MAQGDVTVSINTVNGKKAAIFDGVNDILTVNDNNTLSFGNGTTDKPFSFFAWVYMKAADGFGIIRKGTYNTNGEFAFGCLAPGDSKIRLFLFDESVANCYIGRLYNTALTSLEDTWMHIGFTYDGSGTVGGIKIYINNVRVDDTNSSSNPASYVAMENLAANVEMGKYSSYSKGAMTDMRLYRKELTTAQITNIYQGGEDYVDLVSWWTFKGGSYNDQWGSNNATNNGTYIEVVEETMALQIKSQRVTANDKYMMADLGGQLVVGVIEEA